MDEAQTRIIGLHTVVEHCSRWTQRIHQSVSVLPPILLTLLLVKRGGLPSQGSAVHSDLDSITSWLHDSASNETHETTAWYWDHDLMILLYVEVYWTPLPNTEGNTKTVIMIWHSNMNPRQNTSVFSLMVVWWWFLLLMPCGRVTVIF